MHTQVPGLFSGKKKGAETHKRDDNSVIKEVPIYTSGEIIQNCVIPNSPLLPTS